MESFMINNTYILRNGLFFVDNGQQICVFFHYKRLWKEIFIDMIRILIFMPFAISHTISLYVRMFYNINNIISRSHNNGNIQTMIDSIFNHNIFGIKSIIFF